MDFSTNYSTVMFENRKLITAVGRAKPKSLERLHHFHRKFDFCLGFEFSYIKNLKTEYKIDFKETKKWEKAFAKIGTVSSADGEIEIQSKPIDNYKDLVSTWMKMEQIRKKHSLVVSNKYLGGGGLHIHLDFPSSKKNLSGNIEVSLDEVLEFSDAAFRNFYSRPYLNWIFNEPIDDVNANSDSYRTLSDYLARINMKTGIYIQKKCGLAINDTRLEYRIFEMPRTLKQLLMIVDFTLKFAKAGTSMNRPFFRSKNKYKQSKNDCLSCFSRTLKDIGCIYSYDEYVKEFGKNIDQRFEWGGSYLELRGSRKNSI